MDALLIISKNVFKPFKSVKVHVPFTELIDIEAVGEAFRYIYDGHGESEPGGHA
jgi:hypothetical protein